MWRLMYTTWHKWWTQLTSNFNAIAMHSNMVNASSNELKYNFLTVFWNEGIFSGHIYGRNKTTINMAKLFCKKKGY